MLARKVRVEKCKWAVEDVRRNVLLKTSKLKDENEEADLQELRRGLELTSIAADKQHDQTKEERYQVKKKNRDQQRAEEKARVANGYGNPRMRQTYDAIISGTMDLLRNATLDARANGGNGKPDIRADDVAMQRIHGRVVKEK